MEKKELKKLEHKFKLMQILNGWNYKDPPKDGLGKCNICRFSALCSSIKPYWKNTSNPILAWVPASNSLLFGKYKEFSKEAELHCCEWLRND